MNLTDTHLSTCWEAEQNNVTVLFCLGMGNLSIREASNDR